jgi:site-specific DNA recombinase
MKKTKFDVLKSGGRRAAVYLRKSTDQQEASIPGQRAAVQAYALKHGFDIVEEYTDAGISGVDSANERPQFARMIADAERGKFAYVIAWDLSRITRSDPMESMAELRPLRKAGVRLMLTDREQALDWDSFAGMLMLSVEAESNNQFVRKMARGTARGQIQLAKTGRWVAGRPPLGYRVGEDRFLVLGPKPELQAVQWAFRTYEQGSSYRAVQRGLAERGFEMVLSSVKNMLTNPVYVGDAVWGRNCQAKFYSYRGGEITSEFEGRWTSKDDQIIVADAHPPIVTREAFNRVQALLPARKRASTPIAGGGPYVLSGLLRCGDCGYGMVGAQTPLKDGGSNVFYRCNGFFTRGVEFCHAHNVFQDDILKAIFATLADRLDNPENAKRLRVELERQLKARSKEVDTKAIDKQLRSERAKLEKAVKRLVEVDSDLVPIVQDQVREIKLKVARLEDQAKAATTDIKESLREYDTKVQAAVELFKHLRTIYRKADPQLLRSFLQQSVEEIQVHVTRSLMRGGNKYSYKFEGGKIIGKEGSSLFGSW